MAKITLTANVLAQGLHTALGGLCVALPGWLWGSARAAAIGTVSALVFAAIKEAWFDRKYETTATAGSGWQDFAFWLVGIVAAWALHFAFTVVGFFRVLNSVF